MSKRIGIQNTNQVPRAKRDLDETHHMVYITHTTTHHARRDNCITAEEAIEKSIRMLKLADPDFGKILFVKAVVCDRWGNPV